ncbi:PAS domain S-box protein, partial [Leptolyngbya sp. FACHB-36]|uniref:PAS domain-containing protein n=1 Tax=Leptolyngbya sp. FACHB-36 TaxID=2692808 RepID=UPI0016801AC0
MLNRPTTRKLFDKGMASQERSRRTPQLSPAQDPRPDEAQLRLALDAARLCTWDWNLQTKEITWSSGHERLFGASVGTIGRAYAAFEAHVHPDDRAGIQAAISRVQQNYQHEFRVVWSDGSVHWLEGRGRLFYDDRGIAIRLLGVVMDIGDGKQTQDAAKQTNDVLELRTVTKQLEAERRVTEAALRESEERFRAAAEGSLDAFYLLQSLRDTRGRIYDFIVVDLNTHGAELISTSRAAAIGQRLHELFPVDRIGTLFRRFVRVVETRQVLEEEVQLALTGVNASWVRYQLVPLADGVAVSSRDISDRKRAEIALQESNRRWRSLLENVRLVVVGLDTSGTIEYANPFFLQLVGYCYEDILGADWFEIFTPAAQRQQVHTMFQELTTRELHLYYQTAIVTRSGEERTIAWNNTLLRDEYGAV